MYKILLVIAVIPVGLGDGGVDPVQRALHEVVHLLNPDALGVKRLALFGHEAADEIKLLLREGVEHALGALGYGPDDLFDVERLAGPVFLDDVHRLLDSLYMVVKCVQ